MRRWITALAALLLGATVMAQDPPADSEADLAAAKKTLLEQLAKNGVRVDEKAQTIDVAAVVNRPADPLEYLLIHRLGKGHEALFVTEAKPSLLNSAFLLLGWEPGENASFKPIDPPPTDEEVRAGADYVEVFPPKGMPLWITVRWTDDKGEKKEFLAEDLLVDLTTEEPIVDNQWVYLGGRMAPLYRGEPPVFVADFEGNLVSVCYLAPENHLATMSHERARDDQNWWMTRECPKPGTEVTVTFHRIKPELVTAREQRIKKQKEQSSSGDDK